VALAAAYRTVSTWIGGYQGEVTISNPGQVASGAWTVAITLPLLGLTVNGAQGADYRQSGRITTFTPTATTGAISPGSSVRFAFSVNGVGQPTGCSVDGRACTGLPG
jgi:endoglucanase